MGFSLQDLLKAVSTVEPDLEKSFVPFIEKFDELSVLTLIKKIYGPKLSVDLNALEKEVASIKTSADETIQQFDKTCKTMMNNSAATVSDLS